MVVSKIKKCICILISLIMVFSLVGCGDKSSINTSKSKPVETYDEFTKKLDKIIENLNPSINDETESKLLEDFQKLDDIDKVDFALGLADDMTMSCISGVLSDGMLSTLGKIVKEYPHPLLLNNYSAILVERSPADSLFLLLQAIEMVPDNPIFLTNIANIYVQLDDYSAAERYASEALIASPDFGPAYQVLTTCHLKNGNSILAAETMVKSAKHCFNEVTIHHFESYLEAVEALDPEKDEYPLQEEFLKELHVIARENVDTKDINDSIDTPEAQLDLKEFPYFTGKDLLEKESYLSSLASEINIELLNADRENTKYFNAFDDYMTDEEKGENRVFPIKKNIRQVYAFRVLESFYVFKMEKAIAKYEEIIEEGIEKFHERVYVDGKEEYQKLEDKLNAEAESYKERIDKLYASNNYEDIVAANKLVEEYMPIGTRATLQLAEFQVKIAEENLEAGLSDLSSLVTTTKEYYNEIKQILEEYWLKSGGILKYVNHEEIFYELDSQRRKQVFEYIGYPISRMASYASETTVQSMELDMAKQVLLNTQMILAELENDRQRLNELTEQEKQNEVDSTQDVDDGIPDIEKEAFTKYKEIGDLPDIRFEGGFMGFGASLQTDGERVKFGYETPVSSSEMSRNILYDKPSDNCYTESYTAIGGKAQGNTEWFKSSKNVKKIFGANSKKILGNIGFSSSVSTGEYICKSKDNQITDRGIIYIRESGGDISDFGRTEKVVVRKSSITGFALKTQSVKYRFKFGSISK
ncbi:MAG: hypothetical protein WDA24_04430 [Tissierellales bacterium]